MRESKKDGVGKACLPGGGGSAAEVPGPDRCGLSVWDDSTGMQNRDIRREKYLPDVPASVLNEMGEKPLLSARRMAVRLRVYQQARLTPPKETANQAQANRSFPAPSSKWYLAMPRSILE